jgi:hypothetical protein
MAESVHIPVMTAKYPPKPKLTDAERHKRFVDTAREVEASDDSDDFDRAFEKVVSPPTPKQKNHKD